jgi:hypothetical protein
MEPDLNWLKVSGRVGWPKTESPTDHRANPANYQEVHNASAVRRQVERYLGRRIRLLPFDIFNLCRDRDAVRRETCFISPV